MSKACVYRPKVEGTNKPSKLFDELARYYGATKEGREDAKYMYAISKLPAVERKLQNAEKDENGEPTIQALNNLIPLDIVSQDRGKDINALSRSIGAKNTSGEYILYNDISQIINTVNSFNLSHLNHTAVIRKTEDGKYYIKVANRNAANKVEASSQMFNNNLYNRLRAILNRAGFEVAVDENLDPDGIFDPLNMGKTVDGLRTIIKIANGQRGDDAFPEEFAHFIIEGLRNDPFVQRLLKTITPETVQQVLGDAYSSYDKLYNGDEDLLKREAAAKILQSYIINKPITIQSPKSLLARLWEKIKSIFRKITEGDIDTAIADANKGFAQLADSVLDESIIPTLNFKGFNATLYAAATKVGKEKDIAEKALEIASKRLLILRSRSKSGKLSDADEKNVAELDKLVQQKKYTKGCLAFLEECLRVLTDPSTGLEKELQRDYSSGANPMLVIRNKSKTLRKIEEFSKGYAEIVRQMMDMPGMLRRGEVEMTPDDANSIATIATQISTVLNSLDKEYKAQRYQVLLEFLQMYYGKERLITVGKNKNTQLTLTKIMDMADHDINFLDALISSMSDANDPMLSIVHRIVVENQDARDDELKDIFNMLKKAEAELKEAGYNSDFMIERDSNGNKTGNFISDIDFTKYYEDRKAYKESLKGKPDEEIRHKMEQWENEHTEDLINPYSKGTVKQVERVPKKELYPSNALNKLSKAQRDYYDTMLDFKKRLQARIPNKYVHTYRAVQITEDFFEGLGTNPKNTAKQFFSHLQDRFVRREFDLDYGEDWIDDKTKRIISDFSGNPLQKLPIYYTGRLKDMSRLSTDVTSSMIAYASMAVNYSQMSEIIDTMELLRSFIHEREYQVTSGNSSYFEKFSNAGREFINKYTKKGEAGNIGKRIDDFYEAVIYGKKKIDHGTIKIPGTDFAISTTETADALKEYTGIVGLGLNTFSAISNVTVGKMQMWIEAAGGEYFGFKDMIKARKEYYALLAPYLGELNSSTKSSKMAILIDEFDALEEFYNDLKNTKYTGSLRRMMDNASLLFMQNMGEHYLHTGTMFAILYNRKASVNGKEGSLYDALDIEYTTTDSGKKVGGRILFKEGTVLENGQVGFSKKHLQELRELTGKGTNLSKEEQERVKELLEIQKETNTYLRNIRFEINKVNQSLNGAFNERDKGAIHRNALGRLAMQFRQWMPGHYYRRFAGTYYDAMLGQWREGYYRTIWKFGFNLLKDLKKGKFQVATNWANLSTHEKANMRRGLTELAIFATLAGLIAMLGPVKKEDESTWHDRMIAYQLRRLYLEAGASIPFTPDFFQNITTLLQSPAAAIKSFNNLADLLQFWNLFDEIESGRYKGWSVYHRDFIEALPAYGQIRKNIDLPSETYMFNVFNH